MNSDFQFCLQRLLESRAAAAEAVHPDERRVHDDLAASYLAMARACMAAEEMRIVGWNLAEQPGAPDDGGTGAAAPRPGD